MNLVVRVDGFNVDVNCMETGSSLFGLLLLLPI